jgi:U3 small nucleolar ribonucleoprotein protein IMP3
MRRYHIQDRDDYAKYNRLCGSIHHLALRLSKLPSTDPFRGKTEASLLGKCYDMALVDVGNKMSDLLSKVTVSSFARRRLGVVMVRLKMSETVKQVSAEFRYPAATYLTKRCLQAVTYIEQGQVRVGPDAITDPAFLVTRNMEDFVSWVDQSRVRRSIAKYTGEHDDYDLL